MKIYKTKISDIPNYLQLVLHDAKENLAYLEQIRVKEYSNKIPPLDGKRQVIIPYSGGLDSSASLLMALESGLTITTVNFNYGQLYFEKENRVISKIKKTIKDVYPESQGLWKSHYEIDISWLDQVLKSKISGHWKHIFPLRNYLIIQESSKYAISDAYTELWFSCVKGEIPYSGGDKSSVFLTYMSQLLSDKHIFLVTPLIGLEKTDIVHWSLFDKRRYQVIKQTISCFSGDKERQCGNCQSCFNRGVAFFCNGKIADVGFSPDKENMGSFVEHYSKHLNSDNNYSPERRKQIRSFISFLETND